MEIDPAETAGNMAEMRESLAESEARYRSLVLATSQMVWTADAAGQVTTERAWDDYTGVPARGEGWLAALHPADAGRAASAWFAAVRSGAMYEAEYRIRRSDGVYRYFSVRAVPVRAPDGAIREWVGVCVDTHEQRRAALAQRVLADANALLGASLVTPEVLEEIARLAVGGLAELCVIDLLDEAGGVRRVAGAHADPARQPLVDELRRRYPADHAMHPLVDAWQSGETLLGVVGPELFAGPRRAPERDDGYRDLLRRLDARWFMLAPLVARGRVLGVVAFVRGEAAGHYDEAERQLAEELARRAALALDNARLYQAEQLARQTAERAARRTARLQTVAVALAQSLSSEQLAEVVVRESVAALEATAGVMALLEPDGQSLRIVRPQGYDHAQLAGFELIPLAAELPLTQAARERAAVYLHDAAERDRRFPGLGAVRNVHQAWSVAPLLVEERILGVLGLSYDRPQLFGDDDRDLIEVLAGQCAQALERARLFEAARQSQAARDESLALLDTLIANAPIGLGFVDCEQRFVRVNHALAQMNNRPAAEHLGRTLAEVLTEAPEPAQRAVAQVMATGEPAIDVEIVGAARPGQRRFWLASYYPVRAGSPLGDGALLGVGIVVSDISERKAAEERLRFLAEATSAVGASLEPLTTIETIARLCAATLADWCMIELTDGRGGTQELALAHRDPAKTPLLAAIHAAYPPDSATPRGSREVLRTGVSQWVPRVSAAMLAAGAKDAEHARLLAEAGMSSYLCVPLAGRARILGTLSLASAQADQPFSAEDLALAEDLGRRVALAVENAQLYAAAREALTTRDQFLSIAAHELKTPITTMLGYGQLIQRRAAADGLPARTQRSIQVIIEQTQRLNRLIAALLDLSRIQMGQLTIERAAIDLAALVARIVDETAPGLDRHRLIFAPDGPLAVEGDELRLEQVVQNLLQNAVKYSPGGGAIEIRLAAAAGRAALSVRDEGIGIPSEAVPLLFTRFYRARNVASQQIAGMGLGLYVVKEIVALHGGSVDVASREGAGSTFTIYLPLGRAEAPGGAAAAAP